MYQKTRFFVTAICLTSLLTLFLNSFPKPVVAQLTQRQGLPGRRVGGGTRGECNFSEKSLMALIPKSNLGLAVAANPKLFFYIPQTSDSPEVEFVLNDEAGSPVYETIFKAIGTSGVVSLKLPDSTPLKIGKKYHWYLSVICNAQDRASDVSVDGWIQRVELSPTLASELKKAEPTKRAAVYAAADLWYVALATLAELRLSRPNDATISAEWAQLLQSVGLENIIQEPIYSQLPTKT